MKNKRNNFVQFLLLVLTVSSVRTDSAPDVSGAEKRKHKENSSKSKLKIDKTNPWPFLPSPGKHYSAINGYPSYPFMILSPPGEQGEHDEKLQDQKGSKYFISRRQAVPFPQQTVVGYVPVYYTTRQYYNGYQPQLYMNYYEPSMVESALTTQYVTAGPIVSNYGDFSQVQSPFLFAKRSEQKAPRSSSHDKKQPMKRQFVPRHHWSFSQWPFDSHEYAFTHDPIHSSNAPHLPRWGPMEWGGAGPKSHWAINREGLPSPFGIGLAPHMGGQGFVGLAGRWPLGHGYPLPTNFPTPPHLQHLLP